MADSRRIVGFILAAMTVSAAIGLGLAAATSGAPATGDVDADDVVLWVDIEADGDATWTVEHRVRLVDDDEEAAFERLVDDIEESPDEYEERFEERMSPTVESAATETDREMSIEEVSVTASVESLPDRYGVLTYQFKWTGFAVTEGDELHAGDAISGLFLDDRSRLVIVAPDDYDIDDATPGPDDGDDDAVWIGPTDFATDEPRIVVQPSTDDGSESDDRETGTDTDTVSDEDTADGSVPIGLVGGAAVALAVGVGGVALWARRQGLLASTPDEGRQPDHGGSAETESEGPPEALLSNEERVLRLLTERGGRMRQQAIVEEFDWTPAKTSQVVSGLRDDGEIETYRLGRENVLAFPEEVDHEG